MTVALLRACERFFATRSRLRQSPSSEPPSAPPSVRPRSRVMSTHTRILYVQPSELFGGAERLMAAVLPQLPIRVGHGRSAFPHPSDQFGTQLLQEIGQHPTEGNRGPSTRQPKAKGCRRFGACRIQGARSRPLGATTRLLPLKKTWHLGPALASPSANSTGWGPFRPSACAARSEGERT